MENVDPLGIHTGESIVVAPSQTLTNKGTKLYIIILHLVLQLKVLLQFTQYSIATACGLEVGSVHFLDINYIGKLLLVGGTQFYMKLCMRYVLK